MSAEQPLNRSRTRGRVGLFFVFLTVSFSFAAYAQTSKDPCAQYFTHDPAEPFIERSVVDHDGFLQAEHFRTSLLLMRDNPELISRYSEALASRLLGTETSLRKQVDSIVQYPPADPLFNLAHPAFAFEYSSMLKEQPALAAGPALDVYLREDSDWTFLQQTPGWNRSAPNAWIGMFLFPRSVEVDRDLTYSAREAAPTLEKQLQLAARRESSKLWYPLVLAASDYTYNSTTRQLIIKPDLLAPASVHLSSLQPTRGSSSLSFYQLPDTESGSGPAEDSVHIPGSFRTLLPELSTWRGMVDFHAKAMAAALDRQLHLPAITVSPGAAITARLDHPDTILHLRLFLDVQHAVPNGGATTEFVLLARVGKVDVVDEKGQIIESVPGHSLPAATGVPGPAPRAIREGSFASGNKRTKGMNCRNIEAHREQTQRETAANSIVHHAANKAASEKSQACNEQAARQADAAGPSPGPVWQAALKAAREACLANGPSQVAATVIAPAIPPTAQPLVLAENSTSAKRNASETSVVEPEATHMENRFKIPVQPDAASIAERTQQAVQQALQAQADRIESLKHGVVRVEAHKEIKDTGTGIILSSSPESILILTALHIVDGAQSLSVIFYSNQQKPYPARKLPSFSSALDLAVLEVVPTSTLKLPTSLPTYNFAANNTLYPTEHIWSVDGDWTLVANNITRLNHEGDPQRFEYSNVSVGDGFSGGPVFDDFMDVIGMHDALNGRGNYAVAIKIESALQVLEALSYTVPKAGPVVMPNYSLTPTPAAPIPAPRTTPALPPSIPKAVVIPPPSPCAKGCETTLGALKRVHEFPGLGRNAACLEEVFAMPGGWPTARLFLHITNCNIDARSTTRGTFRVLFAETDRQGDQDLNLGAVILIGSSGEGMLRGENRMYWRINVRDPNFGRPFNLNAVSFAIEPFSIH